MLSTMMVYLLMAVVLGQAAANPLSLLEGEALPPRRAAPRPAELLSRLVAEPRPPAERPDARLGLPSPQELEAIRKVAQILVTLGEQVIPSIISGLAPPPRPPPAPAGAGAGPAEDAPNDPVNY